jgi:hypothetical protein
MFKPHLLYSNQSTPQIGSSCPNLESDIIMLGLIPSIKNYFNI